MIELGIKGRQEEIVTTLMLIAILILLIRKWKPRRKKANG